MLQDTYTDIYTPLCVHGEGNKKTRSLIIASSGYQLCFIFLNYFILKYNCRDVLSLQKVTAFLKFYFAIWN